MSRARRDTLKHQYEYLWMTKIIVCRNKRFKHCQWPHQTVQNAKQLLLWNATKLLVWVWRILFHSSRRTIYSCNRRKHLYCYIHASNVTIYHIWFKSGQDARFCISCILLSFLAYFPILNYIRPGIDCAVTEANANGYSVRHEKGSEYLVRMLLARQRSLTDNILGW